jgi:hypothetical protein
MGLIWDLLKVYLGFAWGLAGGTLGPEYLPMEALPYVHATNKANVFPESTQLLPSRWWFL